MTSPRCRKGLHEMTPANTRVRAGRTYCTDCRREARQRLRQRRNAIGFATFGASVSAGKRAAHAVRKANGIPAFTPEGLAAQAARRERMRQARRWCRSKKHPWIPMNILTRPNGTRVCRRCVQDRRAERTAREAVRSTRLEREGEIEQLWQARLAAHPDRGGSNFAKANDRFERYCKKHGITRYKTWTAPAVKQPRTAA